MSELADVMFRSLHLATANQPESALRLLDEYIDKMIKDGSVQLLPSVTRHAGIIADAHLGVVRRAKKYYEMALKYDRHDPYTLLALAELCLREQDINQAQAYLEAGRDVAARRGDVELVETFLTKQEDLQRYRK